MCYSVFLHMRGIGAASEYPNKKKYPGKEKFTGNAG